MDTTGIEAALRRDRAATRAQYEQLRRDLDDVVAAAADVATDDEHDPEGATIAYERSRTKALMAQAEAHPAEIESAFDRLAAGSFGTCAGCGRPIGAERLQARPVAQTCIGCAAS